MNQLTDSQVFIELADYLKKKYQIPGTRIELKVGLSKNQISNMRRGGSSVGKEEIHRLIQAYPDELTNKAIELGVNIGESSSITQESSKDLLSATVYETLEDLKRDNNRLKQQMQLIMQLLEKQQLFENEIDELKLDLKHKREINLKQQEQIQQLLNMLDKKM